MNTSNTSFKTLGAICIGNAMEWYDFMIYNFMLLFIAQAFFPSHNRVISLLATMASSGVALVIRPLGGVFLAVWADKHGHHKALMLVFYLMAVATMLITFTPTYTTIGLAATCVIVFARLLQGLATGGEFGISSSLLLSLSPIDKKGFYTSLQMVGQLLAILMGSSACLILTLYCSNETLYQFAWRIPFALGLLILPLGWILRRRLQREFTWKKEQKGTGQLFILVKQQKRSLLIAFSLVAGCTGSIYTLFSYMPTYCKLYLNLSLTEAYLGAAVGILVSILTIPFFGALSDRIGKKIIMLCALACYFGLIYPLLFLLNQHPGVSILILVESILGLCIGAYFGVLTIMVSSLFPPSVRSTCLAVSYNSAVMLFGGFAPFIITALIEYTKNPMVFTYYQMTTVSISLMAVLSYQEERETPEHHPEHLVAI
ncbi:TPA: MFS transporter [Legionella pneumophila]|uniref:MFS transporter n=1 Tax=Legionella pneumophila TaxID=446 RepID=UPI0007871628|nr:MFS transporter [Legionella pneumophila]MDW8879873.1 MFS transporter [Legionella pneumophila subsp. fraseri]MDW8962171.1 MFS transporter [Legionella pneumophila subsp. fraseri]MDW9034835.1 MFS transporter [Legionella pneumophila subsp. fraseri]MDW9037489.1 MFS transporter [Legionella pneumophila subsp. fraseri]MDW9040956.1 MFS transporter [Legionella pneumophila subsp. fraseri]